MRILLTAVCCSSLFALAACSVSSTSTPSSEASSQASIQEPSATTQEQAAVFPTACMLENPDLAKGEMLTDALIMDIKQQTGAAVSRVLLPNQAVTLEYSAIRVNIVIDEEMKVLRVYCG